MVGRPTSDLLLDTNLIPFQVSTKLPILSHRQPDSLTTFISMEPSIVFLLHFDFEETEQDWLKHAGIAWVLLGGKRRDETKCEQFDKGGSNFLTHISRNSKFVQKMLKSDDHYHYDEFDYQEAISSTIKLNDEGLVIGLLEFLQNDKKIKVKI